MSDEEKLYRCKECESTFTECENNKCPNCGSKQVEESLTCDVCLCLISPDLYKKHRAQHFEVLYYVSE